VKQGYLANEAAQGRIRQSDKDRLAEKVDRLRTQMATPAGRAFLIDLMEDLGLDEVQMGPDPRFDAFREGRRSVAHGLRKQAADQCPDLLRLLLIEQLDRKTVKAQTEAQNKVVTDQET